MCPLLRQGCRRSLAGLLLMSRLTGLSDVQGRERERGRETECVEVQNGNNYEATISDRC